MLIYIFDKIINYKLRTQNIKNKKKMIELGF